MRRLSLRPYHGEIILCDSTKELRRHYERITKTSCPYEDAEDSGRFVLLEGDSLIDRQFLIYAKDAHCLAHEIAHVLLIVFRTIGHDPREGDGEPFCYMLSQLMLEARE